MKRSITITGVAIIALFSVAVLVAGTQPAAAEPGMSPVTTPQEASADVQATLNSACATCHDLSAVQPGLYTTAEWQATIDRMLGYGASLTADQTTSILSYLATDAPAEESGGVDAEAAQALLNSSCATCHDLSGIEPDLYTTAEWTDTINRMLGYGAVVSDAEFELLIGYLASDAGGDEVAAEDEAAAEVDVAAAQAVLNSSCATCHDLSGTQPGLYTAAEWTDTINRMIGYGVVISESEIDLILDYLATDR